MISLIKAKTKYRSASKVEWYYKKRPISYRIKIGPIYALPPNIEGFIDQFNYTCTCEDYIGIVDTDGPEYICKHICNVNKYKRNGRELKVEKSEHELISTTHRNEILDDLSIDASYDRFNYKNILNNPKSSILNLRLSERRRRLIWPGYEMICSRHELGRNIYVLSKHFYRFGYNPLVAELDEGSWLVRDPYCYTDTNMVSFSITLITDSFEQCLCSIFETCNVCILCRHKARCECKDYFSGQICRHLHAVFIAKDQRKANEGFSILRHCLYMLNNRRRYYVINMPTRIRHNQAIADHKCIVITKKTKNNITKYSVKHQSDKGSGKGSVKILKTNCDCNDYKKCYICRICHDHFYKCSCTDYKNSFICVHIHALHCYLKKSLMRIPEDEPLDYISLYEEPEKRDPETENQLSRGLATARENRPKNIHRTRLELVKVVKFYHKFRGVEAPLPELRYYRENNFRKLISNLPQTIKNIPSRIKSTRDNSPVFSEESFKGEELSDAEDSPSKDKPEDLPLLVVMGTESMISPDSELQSFKTPDSEELLSFRTLTEEEGSHSFRTPEDSSHCSELIEVKAEIH